VTDILKQSVAPITSEAWSGINAQAARILKANLTARRVVDFSGPHGWEYSAVNIGRLGLATEKPQKDIHWGTRLVQPLVELRVPFFLKQMELDCISRGAKDPDLGPLDEAISKAARFEDTAVFQGFAGGGVQGILQAASHKPITLTDEAASLLPAVSEGARGLMDAGVDGPYALVLGSKPHQMLVQGQPTGYPLRKRIESLVSGGIHWTPVLDGGVILSTRGGDFELTVGQDFSIGYCSHDRDRVELYVAESFTFRVLEPAAAVPLKLKV
jgi:uncharacterized linocin/CFP29 family protein